MRTLLPALLVLALALILPAGANPIAPQAAPTPKKLTLAQALTALTPPADGLWLTVSAEQVTLPDDAEPPTANANLGDIAAVFGDQTINFGTVTAVAPQTMVLLNTQPDPPDLSTDLNRMTALNMLTASLDDTQWQALTSEHGLGQSDLTDDIQRSLFQTFFPHGQLWVESADPALNELTQVQRTDRRDLSDQISGTRLRLGQTAHIYLHDRQGKTLFFSSGRPNAAQSLQTWRPKFPTPAAQYNVTLRAEVSNTLKTSDLDWDSPVLQAPIPTTSIKTVGELITRIDGQTKLELYADPHYAARTLTVRGAAATAPIADLLQALCLCVTGTFRKVGPAYVLTDDLVGVGVRRQRLQEWQDAAFNTSMTLERTAGSTMLHRRASAARSLPGFGDPLALTADEMAAMPDMAGMPGIPSEDLQTFPFAKLTPAQQDWMRQTAADYDDQLHKNTLPDYLNGDNLAEADLTRPVNLRADYHLQMLVPTISAPVDPNLQIPLSMLFYPGATPEANKAYAEREKKAIAKLPPAPPLRSALSLGRCRAVLGHPRTAADVDSLVTAIQKLGLNTLLLDVFSNGVNHVKTSAVNGPDIMTEALNRTRGTGIAVYADLSLLSWGDTPPETVQDLTIEGQNSRNAALQAQKINPSTDYKDDTGEPIPFAAPPVQVSPSSPSVQTTLTTLVQEIAAWPRLSGFVWEDAEADDTLGYTPDMRLAFLRSDHADPIDVYPGYSRADLSLPLFDDKAIDAALPARWEKAKAAADTDLLGQLRTAALTNSNLPILMEQGWNMHLWYASWDNPKSQPPPLRELSFDNDYATNVSAIKRVARTQGQIVLRRELIENDGDTLMLARTLQEDAKTLPGDGFVLDFSHDEVTQGAAPLDSLVRAVSANKAVK
jgi:hypothetical protein